MACVPDSHSGGPGNLSPLREHCQGASCHYSTLVLTTSRCFHYLSNEFSLPAAVVTTEATSSHHQSLLSPPGALVSRLLSTSGNRCKRA